MREDDAQLDEFIAKGSLSGAQHDEVLAKVLRRTEAVDSTGVSRRFKWPMFSAAALAGCGAWLLLMRHQVPYLAAKGGDGPAPAIDAACAPSGTRHCRVGETLMFSVNTALTGGWLGAYAERVGSPTDDRIWYFPTKDGVSPRVEAHVGTVILSQGIELGAEHRPGLYRITTWIARRALLRDEVDGAESQIVGGRNSFEIDVSPSPR